MKKRIVIALGGNALGKTPEEQLKLEIAEEIGVFDKVIKSGWRSLSAKESGKIGGMMAKRKKQLNKGQE